MYYRHSALVRRSLSIAVVAALAAGTSTTALAQATTGTIYGDAPAAANETVLIESSSGVSRTVQVDERGRYSAGSLPLGTYSVTLLRDGATVDSRKNVTLTLGGGTQVSFSPASSSSTTNLSSVEVTANALPAIDVTQVDSRTTITADQLARLPLQRSAEAVATLAPGVNRGSSYFTSPTGQVLNSFGGSSIAENAYYINGFNTSDPLKNFGGLTLPYGAIDQEQVLTGGYGAQYGRSDGGVISQVGKRGTNEWHFGAQILFQPKVTNANPKNTYYPSGPQYLAAADGGAQGEEYAYRNQNKSSTEVVDAYFGGPLIKDKLFIFGAVEAERQVNGKQIESSQVNQAEHYSYNDPKYYAKLDWNITDNNILEFTTASNKTEYTNQVYNYTYPDIGSKKDKGQFGDYLGPGTYTNDGARVAIAKYTGYITDDITVDVLYGKMLQTDYSRTAGGPDAPVLRAQNQDPALNGGVENVGPQTTRTTVSNPAAQDRTRNLRLDLNWKLGAHSITAGIDNLDTSSMNIGDTFPGPGYAWVYGHGDPNTPISTLGGQEVAAPGGNGYYVSQEIYTTGAKKVRVKQRAEFVQDEWQVTDRLLLSIGLRNDQFTNYNPDSQPYIRLTRPNLSPRLGASWDVLGDSSLKVYANAGRYYLDEPTNVAIRGAAGSVFTNQYFTYTGIDPATGAPTGLTQIPQGHYPGVSANNEFGVPPNPKTVTSKDVSAEYQDEYIAGLDKAFEMMGGKWTAGTKFTYRKLRNDLDDVCDGATFSAVGAAQGFDPDLALGSGCYIMNPGKTQKFNVSNGDGTFGTMTVPWSAFGMPDLKRKYTALDSYLEHPFDGKWYGRIDYTLAHSFGNTEGSVRSDIGQTDVAQTEDWDNAGVMVNTNGDQANDRRHQIKFTGYWQLTPEWLVGGNAQLLSGTPKVCQSFFGPEQSDPYGYADAYHFCGPEGRPATPGKVGRTPWQEIVSLNAQYRPAFADHKLAFSLLVYNVLNQQRTTQFTTTSVSGPGQLSPDYQLPISYETPRFLQFGISYDF
ncbi:TonB-dependent receptor [Pinirhizobacter soli]|uniref:TonB-dependent receptor n=1 Tax=Pinirhizobacter soli TaxID=2786953 RepID=UPI002029F596|nr:TonB-dependent receptor [Pinirhizobacter soli]